MIAIDLGRALDPALIGADCRLVLDPWQVALMREQHPRILMCCSRQSGKSTVADLIAISTALTHPSALVLLISPSQRQSAELFRSLMVHFRQLADVPEIKSESVLRLELMNGSRIIALPGESNTVRGYSGATLIICDEAARIPDELLAAIRPMLATSNGRLIALSTPHGRQGWFFEAWHGDPYWHRVRVSAEQCPRISKEFLDEEMRELGPQRYAEEYQLAFLDAQSAVFSALLIARAFTSEVAPLWQ